MWPSAEPGPVLTVALSHGCGSSGVRPGRRPRGRTAGGSRAPHPARRPRPSRRPPQTAPRRPPQTAPRRRPA